MKSIARVVVFLSIYSGLLLAQSGNGGVNIGGTVVDQAGKTVPNAVVTLKNESSDAVREVKTADDGHFSASGLPTGKYTVEVTAPGFAVARRTGVDSAAGATRKTFYRRWPWAASISPVTVEAVASVAACSSRRKEILLTPPPPKPRSPKNIFKISFRPSRTSPKWSKCRPAPSALIPTASASARAKLFPRIRGPQIQHDL